MKALSGTQPWFWSILHCGKDIENRSWPTSFRGTIALHASKGMTKYQYQEARIFIEKLCPDVVVPLDKELVRGAIIGVVDIIDCFKKLPLVTEKDSPWFFGDYGFVLRNIKPLPKPIACKGSLGFWDVPIEIEEQIKEQLGI